MTKRRRHTPDQIIRNLAEGRKLLAGGTELDEVCRHLQIEARHGRAAHPNGVGGNAGCPTLPAMPVAVLFATRRVSVVEQTEAPR